MDIKAAEISSILKKQIADFSEQTNVAEIGQVLSIGDGVATFMVWITFKPVKWLNSQAVSKVWL